MDAHEPVVQPTLTADLGHWVSRLKRSDIPDAVWHHAKLCLLDALGCGLHGSRQLWGSISAEVAHEMNPNGPASIWGSARRGGVDGAAMTNGTAIHGFELDDVHMGSAAHLGAVTIPAAIALAEAHGKSASDVLCAVIAGYEAGARIGIAAGPGRRHAGRQRNRRPLAGAGRRGRHPRARHRRHAGRGIAQRSYRRHEQTLSCRARRTERYRLSAARAAWLHRQPDCA
jgi:MmgE/PrpD N-terminal domain